jgi:hypothetical protein
LPHKQLGVHTLRLLVEADPVAFLKRLPVFLPLVHQCLRQTGPGAIEVNHSSNRIDGADVQTTGGDLGVNSEEVNNAVRGSDEKMEAVGRQNEGERVEGSLVPPEGRGGQGLGVDEGFGGQKDVDHLLFSSLSTLNKLCTECDLMGSNSSLAEGLDAMWGE